MSAPNILVVEDNPITLKMLRITLEAEGYRVLPAPDGRTALNLAARHAPDLIILDIVLPDMNGFELLQRLRQTPGGAQAPILGVSGFITERDEGRAAAAGFNDILVKPVAPSHLIQAVRAFLPRGREAAGTVGAGRRVLLVDDDAIQRKLLALSIRSLGFRVETAADGEEALDLARTHPPAAILSDVFMPRRDGFDLCLAVRSDPRLGRIPFVLFSSFYVEQEDRALGFQVGANAWVDRSSDSQPITDALLAALEEDAPPVAPGPTAEVRRWHFQRLFYQLERQAVQNAGLARRCALQAAELSILSGISDTLARALDAQAIPPEILYRCLDAGGLSRGALYLTEPDGRVVLRAQIGYDDVAAGEVQGFFGHSEMLRAIAQGQGPLVIPSPVVPDATAHEILDRSRGTYALIAPLLSHGQSLGAVLMGSRSQRLAEEDWGFFARTVAAQIGQALALGRAFSQLAASEQRLQHLLSSSPTIIFGLRIEGGAFVPVTISENVLRIMGHSSHEILGKPDWWADHLHPEDRAGALEARAALVARGHLIHEYRFRHGDGTYRWVRDELRVLPDAAGHPMEVVGSWVDVTERKQTEETLRQSEKLATMGQLLAGVAHELNNPLGIVIGQSTLLTMQAKGTPMAGRAQKIIEASERCARIGKNFLTMARQRPPERQVVRLNVVVRETVEMLAYQLRTARVQVAFDLLEGLPPLWADPFQLQQVVVNLVVNAQQALRDAPGERRITLSTRHDPGRTLIVLEVADTGPGIPPEARPRLFEPLFTTKRQGSGTGLGLSLCKGIVEGHGGAIHAESEPGQGALFRVELPAKVPSAGAGRPRLVEGAAIIRGKTALVVDDEPEIAQVLAEILRLDGHQVELADSGAVGLEKVRRRSFDVILCDMRMPDMDGPGLFRELERGHPELRGRCVFLTGDTLNAETREFFERTNIPRVGKPFSVEDIREVVQRILQSVAA